ncbi:hypothetical protein LCGC14_0737630 [marine sediment metagenome]|uniref:Uncharacterized protein n=1 Tax=marine sediment metagenome TaxID=412755 RepID=A0A0F9QSL3_9ZZZZ
MNKEDKLYMKWWFWVIIGILFIFIISLVFVSNPELEECQQELDDWVEWFDEYQEVQDKYDQAIENYCEIDYENPLCDALLPYN